MDWKLYGVWGALNCGLLVVTVLMTVFSLRVDYALESQKARDRSEVSFTKVGELQEMDETATVGETFDKEEQADGRL